MILGMGLAYGGLAQVIAGIMEYKKGNTFGTVAFTSYGLFWWSFVLLSILPKYYFFIGLQSPSDEAMAAYFLVWGLFTLLMFFGTLKSNRVLQFVFISLATLFFLLSAKSAILAYNPSISSEMIDWFTRIIGIEGIVCGFSAFYLAMAQVINEVHEKTIMPT